MTGYLLEAFKVRWDAQQLDERIVGGITVGEARERSTKPYAVVDPVSEIPSRRTNRTRNETIVFQVTIYDETFDLVSDHAWAVKTAMEEEPLTMANGEVMEIWASNIVYLIEPSQHYKAVVEFTAITSRRRSGVR